MGIEVGSADDEQVVAAAAGDERFPAIEKDYMMGVRVLRERGVTKVPTKYIFPVSDRANRGFDQESLSPIPSLKLPVIDVDQLLSPATRAQTLRILSKACEDYGFFQIVNHNIPEVVVRSMVDCGRRFFNLPFKERQKYMIPDLRAPVRYGTSFNQNKDRIFCWRDFLKLSCHPLPAILPSWPISPPDLRDHAVAYAKHSRSLFQLLAEAVVESLGLREAGDVLRKLDVEGSQLMVVNYYPDCPQPELTLGMPPHSDYGFLTLVIQDGVRGLQIQRRGDGCWVTVEPDKGTIVVNVGDHLEIFSNGRYRSALHRVLVNPWEPRLSVATLHSLPFEASVRPSPELIDEAAGRSQVYMESCYSDFVEYLFVDEDNRAHKTFLQSRRLV